MSDDGNNPGLADLAAQDSLAAWIVDLRDDEPVRGRNPLRGTPRVPRQNRRHVDLHGSHAHFRTPHTDLFETPPAEIGATHLDVHIPRPELQLVDAVPQAPRLDVQAPRLETRHPSDGFSHGPDVGTQPAGEGHRASADHDVVAAS